MGKINLVFFSLLITLFLLINWTAINSYFSQDDFFHLRQILDKSIWEVPKFFLPSNDLGYAFYRPLSREFFGFITYNLFSLNALIFHLINVMVIFLIGVSLFRLVGLLTKSKLAQYISVIIYGLSAVHNIELFYLSSIQTLFAALFVLLSIIKFYEYCESDQRQSYYYSILFFALGLLSHESAVVVLPLIGLLRIFKKNNINFYAIKVIVSNLKPFLILFSFRILIYFFTIRLPKEEVYRPSFYLSNILNTLSWYILWTLGLPEILVDFMTLTLNFNPNFFRFYSDYASIVFPSFILLVLAIVTIILLERKTILRNRILFLLLAAFLISLTPFVFFPRHKFIYYLSLPTVFLSALLGSLFAFIQNKNLFRVGLTAFLISFALIAISTVLLNEKTYWAAKRAKAAKYIISDTLKKYPNPSPNTAFLIKNDPFYPNISKEWGSSSRQAFYILSGSDAFQLIYKDPTIKVFYEDINDQMNILGVSSERVHVVNAKFPY